MRADKKGVSLLQKRHPSETEDQLHAAVLARPDDPQPLTALAAAHVMNGRLADAERVMRRAVEVWPDLPHLHSNLGNVLRDLGRLQDAERSLRAALRLHPQYPDLHNNYGVVLVDLGRRHAAERSFRRALQHQPDHASARHNLGRSLHEAGRHGEAVQAFDDLLRAHPGLAGGHCDLGVALRSLGNLERARSSLLEALRIEPGLVPARMALGGVLHDLGRATEAADQFRAVTEAWPGTAEAHLGLGVAVNLLGRFADAEASLTTALRQRPDLPEAYNSLGDTLRNMRRLDEATVALQAALRLRPTYPEAQVSLAFVHLQAGRYAEGWRLHEARWGAGPWRKRTRPAGPAWRGERLDGRRLLLLAEQGLGDTLQFCRYASLIPPGGRIVLQVQAPLVRLLRSLAGVEAVYAPTDMPAQSDVQQSLMSLPHIFGTTLDTVPTGIPYLRADPSQVAAWRDRLSSLPGLRVGLVWAGDPSMAADSRRSLTLAELAPLAPLDGVSYVSLQLGALAGQRAPAGLSLHDVAGQLSDFADTAAAVSALDLIIAVDTAVIHLAGALGRPAWLLNRFDTCWRWLAAGDSSPWYPTLRLFRQPAPGDWATVLQNVRDALQDLARNPPPTGPSGRDQATKW